MTPHQLFHFNAVPLHFTLVKHGVYFVWTHNKELFLYVCFFFQKYIGQDQIRGINVDHWQACIHWESIKAYFTVDYYFTSKWAFCKRFNRQDINLLYGQ